MGLLTWAMLTVVILSIIGKEWNVFVSSIFRGIDKILNGISPIAIDLGSEAKQYADISSAVLLLVVQGVQQAHL